MAEFSTIPKPSGGRSDSNPAFLGIYRWNILRKVQLLTHARSPILARSAPPACSCC